MKPRLSFASPFAVSRAICSWRMSTAPAGKMPAASDRWEWVKNSDSRAASYIRRHGAICWEADILPGGGIEAALDAHIGSWLDHDLWGRRISEIERARRLL